MRSARRARPDGTSEPSSDLRLSYSVERAADRLDIGRTKTFELIRDGRLKAVRCDGRTLITEDALREFLASLPRV